jgi:uncharacterized protein (TIGR03435 family)
MVSRIASVSPFGFARGRLFWPPIILCAIGGVWIGPRPAIARTYVGQSPSANSAQGQHLSFEVASVRQNTAGFDASGANKPHSNFPIGSDDSYSPTGEFSATNLPLISYIIFAYKITTNNRDALIASVPDWVLNDGYNIEARTEMQDVTKDQMRLMMQSLLADRFKLAVHHEEREVPVFAAVLGQPGKLGPHLRKHMADADCPQATTAAYSTPATDAAGFPVVCNGFANSMHPDAPYHRKIGGGNVTLATMVSGFSGIGNLGRPVVDQTGLSGGYDFVLDYLPDPPLGKDLPSDASGPDLVDAVKSQLGIKLDRQKAAIDFVIVDHIKKPSPN